MTLEVSVARGACLCEVRVVGMLIFSRTRLLPIFRNDILSQPFLILHVNIRLDLPVLQPVEEINIDKLLIILLDLWQLTYKSLNISIFIEEVAHEHLSFRIKSIYLQLLLTLVDENGLWLLVLITRLL